MVKRFVLAVVMMFVLVCERVYGDFVNLGFVREEEEVMRGFVVVVLVFMRGYVNEGFGIRYGFILGVLYDIN